MANIPNNFATPAYPDLRPDVPPRGSSTARNIFDKTKKKVSNFGRKDRPTEKPKQKNDPDVLNKLSRERQDQLPVELLNEIDVDRLAHLHSHILKRVSENRICEIPEDRVRYIANHHPHRLAVVLTKAPGLMGYLNNKEVGILSELDAATFLKLPDVVKERLSQACPEYYQRMMSQPQHALPHQPAPNTHSGDPQVRAQQPVRSASVQPSPSDAPVLPPVNFTTGPRMDATPDAYSPVNATLQAPFSGSHPEHVTQFPPPSTTISPRTYSLPHNTYHSQFSRYPLSSSSPPPSSSSPINGLPVSQTSFGTPAATLVTPSMSLGLSRSSSPTGYFKPNPQSYSGLQGPLNQNGNRSTLQDSAGPPPAVPPKSITHHSFEMALPSTQAQGELSLPIQNPDPQSFRARQQSQIQGEPADQLTKDERIRDLEAQAEAWKIEKTTLTQKVASLTESLESERERLESERKSTGTLHQSIGSLKNEKERLENEKKLVEDEKQRVEHERDALEREQIKLEGGIKKYLAAKKWKGLEQQKTAFDMIIDYCNEQLASVADWEDYNKEQTARVEKIKLENERLVQSLKDQDELIAERNKWWGEFEALDNRLKQLNPEHERRLQEEKNRHQHQLQEERKRHQHRFNAEIGKLNTEIEALKRKLDSHKADQLAATEKVRTTLQAEIDTLRQEKNIMQTQYQSYKDAHDQKLKRLTEEHEVALSQQKIDHEQKMQAFHAQCQDLINQVGIQWELNKQQAVKDLENKVRLLESSLVDNSDDYRPATDDHLQVDFDQLNLDISKITHNLPAVDFFQVNQLDPGGFLEREGRDQLRFLLQGIFWEHMMYGFFSAPFGLGALGPQQGKQRLLEVWIAYRKLLGTEKSEGMCLDHDYAIFPMLTNSLVNIVRLPIGEYDMATIEQDYVNFLRNDKETNKWRSSTFQAVMAALLPKKDKAHSSLSDYLSSPFFQNRNNVRENILTELRRICVGGIPQAIEQTVEKMVFKASELALQFGMQRSELGLMFPQRNTLVLLGQDFVLCYDNDAEHGMQKPVFLSVSPMCYKTGDGRKDTTTTKVISPGQIYPHAQ